MFVRININNRVILLIQQHVPMFSVGSIACTVDSTDIALSNQQTIVIRSLDYTQNTRLIR